jgi:IS30 family transposase
LEADQSPDVIAGQSKLTGEGTGLRASTIYKLTEKNRNRGGKMYRKMPRQGRKYRRNRTGVPGKEKLKVRQGQELQERPEGINDRSEPRLIMIDLILGVATGLINLPL